MHFKRLELIGFKSFRDRTVLEFEPGVTAIVGPNGCGKSNVSDAIRWVLGEQSAKDLRGNRMEDVIFNGTQRDEPLGLAEVSLTLSNEKKLLPIEYDEVTITRRIFRSGESEYLLNHVPVRLRDVVELVMGTGLGRTSYAHMAQGKIDEILSARPEERRYLFEEASGITKYRFQKKEALRKLEQTETNLLRVGDILLELGRQIRSLERQADKARRYKEDFEKLKRLDLGVARQERRILEEKIRGFSEAKRARKEEEQNFSGKRETFNGELTRLRQELEEVGLRLNAANVRKVDLSSEIRQGQDRVQLYKERIEELEKDREVLLKEKTQIEEEFLQFRQHVDLSKEEYAKGLEEISAYQTTLAVSEATLKKILGILAESEEAISKGKLKAIDIAQEHSKVRNDLTRMAAEHHTLSSREHRLLLEQEETTRELGEVKARREETEKIARQTKEKLEVFRREKEALEEEGRTLSRSLQTLRVEIQSLRQQWTVLSSQCELLEEARKNYEGFSQGTKAVLKEREQKNPVFGKCHGVLADLLEVAPGYERAVEELLGSMVQALIVEDEDAARQGIRYLKSRGLGRASFIVLSLLQTGKSGDGSLLEKIKTAPLYQSVLASLLGDVSLVETIEQIPNRDASRTYVTQKGECYRRGILTGGTPLSEGFGLIGREARIAALRSEMTKTQDLLKGLLDQEQGLEALLKEKETLLDQKTDACHRWEVELSNQENLREAVAAEEKKIADELSLVVLELEEVRGELQELVQKEAAMNECLQGLEEQERILQEELTALQSLVAQKKEEREKTLVQIAEVRTALDSAKSRAEDQKKACVLLEATLNDKCALIHSKETGAASDAQRTQELTEEIRRLEEKKHSLLGEKEGVEQEWLRSEANQKTMVTEELSFQNQITECDGQLRQLQTCLHDLEMKEQEIQYELRAMEERLRLTYKVELASEMDAQEGTVDVEAVRPEIERLREKLERMGPVNLVAIDEYEELKKRYEFLSHQKEDLERAKEALHEAIQKINRVTRELFLTTFRQIQAHFQDYFRLLFGGGDARLLLLDEQDVLESGIEILACPPGKKLQSVSLLSGGERAMTVIALLFAVFKEKPSPFCVLDEIDAPLDESNIARFTSVLEEFLPSSQFILVTHNKRTISMADIMYGITMEKTGVSKIVSVKFKESIDETNAVVA
ncbi:MAG: chromosome segregation protein SMC [Candidatus Omnitrophota bacterium]